MDARKSNGGARKGAGRKPIQKELDLKRNATHSLESLAALTPEVIEGLRKIIKCFLGTYDGPKPVEVRVADFLNSSKLVLTPFASPQLVALLLGQKDPETRQEKWIKGLPEEF